eukprot:2886956-Amphidinium_carterae.1
MLNMLNVLGTIRGIAVKSTFHATLSKLGNTQAVTHLGLEGGSCNTDRMAVAIVGHHLGNRASMAVTPPLSDVLVAAFAETGLGQTLAEAFTEAFGGAEAT